MLVPTSASSRRKSCPSPMSTAPMTSPAAAIAVPTPSIGFAPAGRWRLDEGDERHRCRRSISGPSARFCDCCVDVPQELLRNASARPLVEPTDRPAGEGDQPRLFHREGATQERNAPATAIVADTRSFCSAMATGAFDAVPRSLTMHRLLDDGQSAGLADARRERGSATDR